MAGYQDRSGGALFPERNRSNEKSPTSTGYIDLNAELVSQILAKARTGEPIKLRIAAWSREGNSGKFLSLAAEMDGAGRKQSGQQFAGNNAGGQQRRQPDAGQQRRRQQDDEGWGGKDRGADFDDEIPF